MSFMSTLTTVVWLSKMAITGQVQNFKEMLFSPPPIPASISQSREPIIQEIPITESSRPFMSAAPLPSGYTEREFSMTGAADYYDFAKPGSWDLTYRKTAGYKTRIVVRQPADPAAFNGTVVVDWFNVTLQVDLDGEWMTQSEALTKQGFAYVGVTVQRLGSNGLVAWNPERYAGMQIWDDGLSYEIYSQTGRLVKTRSHEILGDLDVKHVIAGGASQSAFRLTTYVNAFHPRDHVFDGYMLRGRGYGGAPIRGDGINNGPHPAPIRSDIDVPVMIVQNEGDLLALRSIYEVQPDTPLLRLWEIPGASHGGQEATKAVMARIAREGVSIPSGSTGSAQANFLRSAGVSSMAYHYLQRWVETGEAPPQAPRIQLARDPGPGSEKWSKVDASIIARDEFGNAKGGIRLPDIEVPIGQFLATTDTDILGGAFKPFDTAKLRQLYPTHADYVTAVRVAADKAVANGFVATDYATKMVDDAEASPVPEGLPAYAVGTP